MLQFLLDTDHVSLLQYSHSPLLQNLAQHPPDTVGVSAITVEEVLRGRLAVLARARDGVQRIQHYRHLVEAVQFLSRLQLVLFEQPAEDQFQQLKALRLHVGTQDLKIAAVALANQVTLVTRNRQDFSRIPGLAIDDWSV